MNKLEFAKMMQARTKGFAVQVVKFFVRLPKSEEARVLGRQLLRAGTSVGANDRATCRATSEADFINKLGTVVEESDKTLFWLELLEDSQVCRSEVVAPLKTEADQLTRILATSLTTAKDRAGR